jgi:hypothetical protein
MGREFNMVWEGGPCFIEVLIASKFKTGDVTIDLIYQDLVNVSLQSMLRYSNAIQYTKSSFHSI